MKQKSTKWILFFMQFALLLGLIIYFPWLQNRFPFLQMPDLAGAYTVEEKPVWTVNRWLNGHYQKSMQLYVQENRTVRPLFLRIKNQLLFEGFGKSPNTSIKLGKDNYLFGKQEIYAYLGLNFIGESAVREKTSMLAAIQDYLEASGKALLVVLPPGKPGFVPNKLPANYQKDFGKTSNSSAFIKEFSKQKIPYLAFEHFKSETYKEPFLYPSGGLHWSHMGATLAMDTLIKRIEGILDIQMKQMHVDGYQISESLRSPDNDLGEVLNLVVPHKVDPMPYPRVHFSTDSNSIQPKLLIIGDSYYRLIFDLGYHRELFSHQSIYWHYFSRQITPENPTGIPIDKQQLHLMREVKMADLVLIVSGESNLHQLGFGFIEAFYSEIVSPKISP